MKKAIVLCSGGLDSVTTAFYIKRKLNYKDVTILFFNYNQRNIKPERRCAKICSKDLGAEFVEINLKSLGRISTSLLNSKNSFKKLSKKELKNTKKEGNKWYVPCRNLIFLSYALALADSIFIKTKEKSDIFVGFKNEGKEHYPDTTPAFLQSVNKISKVSTPHFKIFAPLIKKDKEDIILMGKKLNVNFRRTFSCYTSPNLHCGRCLACKLRQQGFYWANTKDPTKYVN